MLNGSNEFHLLWFLGEDFVKSFYRKHTNVLDFISPKSEITWKQTQMKKVHVSIKKWSSTNSRLSMCYFQHAFGEKYVHIYSEILQLPRHRKSLYSNLKYHFLNSFRARKSPSSISQLNCQVRQASRLWNYLVTQFQDFGTESETTA